MIGSWKGRYVGLHPCPRCNNKKVHPNGWKIPERFGGFHTLTHRRQALWNQRQVEHSS